jgi:hypothetical protein
MFTVPDHLPRSAPSEGIGGREGMVENGSVKPDLTLEILGPYLGSGEGWSASQATGIRERLEQAVIDNKVCLLF